MDHFRLTKEQYPYLLREVPFPPKTLYCAGSLPPTDEYKYLCVIGSRQYTSYGKDTCESLIAGLRNYPVVIISGLAIGIDSIAHRSALRNGLKTISFPGSGLDPEFIYPAAHYPLAQEIVRSGGTLLSPFKPNQPGTLWTFPVRNQLMAGSSQATLIIEGEEGSGTLITAKAALDFNREVLVVPGSIFSSHSRGPHHLFSQGAVPVFSSEDILESLGFEITPNRSNQKILDLEKLNLSPAEKLIIRALQIRPLDTSSLVEKTLLSATETNATISRLELRSLIVGDNGIYRIRDL